jgi:hypothetical protein
MNFQSDMAQSTGHPSVAQATVSSNAGHAAPPNAVFCVTVRVFVRSPPPQDTEHLPVVHLDTLQSIGGVGGSGIGVVVVVAAGASVDVDDPSKHQHEWADFGHGISFSSKLL